MAKRASKQTSEAKSDPNQVSNMISRAKMRTYLGEDGTPVLGWVATHDVTVKAASGETMDVKQGQMIVVKTDEVVVDDRANLSLTLCAAVPARHYSF